MGCLSILLLVNDLLKGVLVFYQERDTLIHSHETKVEVVLKTGLQARTVLFTSDSLGSCLWDNA